MLQGSIIGWNHLPFGRYPEDSLETLMAKVVPQAIADAGIEAKDIDEGFVGLYNPGFSKQDFVSSLAMQTVPALRFKPFTRTENACASGSAAIFSGLKSINAKTARFVLVVGVEKMTDQPHDKIGEGLLAASYVKQEAVTEGGFAGIFASIAKQYFQKYGDQTDILAKIAAKNHLNGVKNPYAQLRKDLGFEFCRTLSDKNPVVAFPLKRTDCSLVSDGATALILTDPETAQSMNKAVRFRAAAQVNDFLPMAKRDILQFEGAKLAWQKAFAMSKLSLKDLNLVETHDCFTIAELIEYEAMGLTKIGEGKKAIEEGWVYRDGKLPINLSGGLKAKGHPIGATGVSMHILTSMQLVGQAGEMQLAGNPQIGGIYNMGGAAVANYVSILERQR